MTSFLNRETLCDKVFTSLVQIALCVAHEGSEQPLSTNQISIAIFGLLRDYARAHAVCELITSRILNNHQAIVNLVSHGVSLGLYLF